MSLQKQLLIWVLGCVLAVGLLIQGIVFWHTYQSFSQSQDNNLSYIAELVGSRSTFRLRKFAERENPNRTIERRDNNIYKSNSQLTSLATDSKLSLPPKPSNSKPIGNISDTQSNIDGSNEDNGMLQYQGIKDGIQVDIIPTRVRTAGNEITLPADYQHLLSLPTGFSQVTLSDKVWKVFRKDTPRRIIFVRQPIDWQKKATLQTAWQAIIPILLSVLLLLFLLPFILKKILRPMQSLASQMAMRDEFDLSPVSIDQNNSKNSLPQELRPLVDEINSLLNRIDRHIKGQNRFIANVAHELRSPLTAISLQAQSLQKQLTSSANHHDANWQQKLSQSVEKLVIRVENNQHLVEQLLTFARIDAQQSSSNQQSDTTTSVMPILVEAVTLLFPIADSKDINLSIDNHLDEKIKDKQWQVALDQTSLLIVLKNLIQNAILYTPNSGDVNVLITTTLGLDLQKNLYNYVAVLRETSQGKSLKNIAEPRLVIQIKDTGVGVPTEKYQEIFQPFVRLNQCGAEMRNDSLEKSNVFTNEKNGVINTVGTGLGLSIVYQICQQAKIDIYISATNTKTDNPLLTKGLTVTLVF